MELMHFGVKGMRWGVRKDRKRRGRRRKKDYTPSDDYTRSRNLKKKHLMSLSNREIQELNTRMNLEQQYSRIHATPFQKASSWAGRLLANVGTSLVSQIVRGEAKRGIKETTGFDIDARYGKQKKGDDN